MGLVAVSSLASAEAPGVRVEAAWLRAAPPGAAMLAGYARLENDGALPVRLVSVSGEDFAAVELHRTETVDGMSRMRPVPELEIPPGGGVELRPGGLHLMLMRPRRHLIEGDHVVLRLAFDDDRTLPVRFEVRRQPSDEG